MALIFISEYLGDHNKRSAQVYRHSNGTGYTVQCFDSTVQQRQDVFNTESQAENFAEDWCQEDTASE
jgi:hypothetical protein